MLLLALLACDAAPPLPPPDGDVAVTWVAIELAGVPVGVEERRRAEGVLWRHRRFAFLQDGAPAPVEGTSLAELGPDGRVVSLAVADGDGDVRRWTAGAEPAWLLEVTPREGEVLALDAWTLRAEHTVARDGRWRLGGLPWEAEPGLVRAGPLVLREVERPPALEAIDPAVLLRRPAPALAAPRPRVARFRVNGEAREVRRPLPLTLPRAERRRVEALLGEVPAVGDCKARAAALVAAAARRGIGGRVVHGLVWLDRGGPALVPHAWAELDLAGGPLPVDPTLGQVIADATHLPLDPAEVLTAEVVLLEAR